MTGAGAVTGGITTVLDFMGKGEFGQTMMSLGKTMLTFNKLAQGGGTVKVLGQVVKVTGATKNLGSILATWAVCWALPRAARDCWEKHWAALAASAR